MHHVKNIYMTNGNAFPPWKNSCHFAYGIFKCIFVNEKFVFWLNCPRNTNEQQVSIVLQAKYQGQGSQTNPELPGYGAGYGCVDVSSKL